MLSDTQIIENTKISTDEDGKCTLSILPPGYESPILQRAANKESAQKHIIAWCTHVRGVMQADEQNKLDEMRARKKRKAEGEIVQPEDPEIGVIIKLEGKGMTSAYQYAVTMRDGAYERVQNAESEVSKWKEDRKQARREYENWQKIVESLRGDNDDDVSGVSETEQ